MTELSILEQEIIGKSVGVEISRCSYCSCFNFGTNTIAPAKPRDCRSLISSNKAFEFGIILKRLIETFFFLAAFTNPTQNEE